MAGLDTTNWQCPECGQVASKGHTCSSSAPACSSCPVKLEVKRWYLAINWGRRSFGIGWWKRSACLFLWSRVEYDGIWTAVRLGPFFYNETAY